MRRAGEVDEETRRYAEIIKAKQARLHQLDKQAATMGLDTPPHIEMERQTLQEDLGIMEVALESPITGSLSDDLGPRGRFITNYQQNREIKQSIAALAVEMRQGLAMHRNLFILIGLVVILILVAVVALVTYLFTKGAL
jgi:tetrahydromethanopterin S-methyltransferase subunit G